MRFIALPVICIPLAALAVVACGAQGPTADELNAANPDPLGSGTGTQATPTSTGVSPTPTAPVTTGTPPVASTTTSAPQTSTPTATSNATVPTAPVTNAPTTGSAQPSTPVATTDPTDGAGGAPPATTEPTGAGGTAVPPVSSGGGGTPPMEGTGGTAPVPTEVVEEPPPEVTPYSPRTGSFKMLAYARTAGFPHDSIPAGKMMLQDIAAAQGFELTITDTNEEITVEGLSQYEIVFFMNTTGDIFTNAEQAAYEEWMTMHNGAFAGTHSATDTEADWAFYSEVTGQYYDLHNSCCDEADIQWDAAAASHVTVQGLPNPWRRPEEWYKFNSAAQWETKPGFLILGRVTTQDGGTRPVSYVREWSNFRSFYTSLGHREDAFRDANVIKHITAGIMWAVRREAEIK